MSSEEFRDDIREVIRRHELDPDDLRDLSGDLETLATRWEQTEEVI
jgi:hypothetical protein